MSLILNLKWRMLAEPWKKANRFFCVCENWRKCFTILVSSKHLTIFFFLSWDCKTTCSNNAKFSVLIYVKYFFSPYQQVEEKKLYNLLNRDWILINVRSQQILLKLHIFRRRLGKTFRNNNAPPRTPIVTTIGWIRMKRNFSRRKKKQGFPSLVCLKRFPRAYFVRDQLGFQSRGEFSSPRTKRIL